MAANANKPIYKRILLKLSGEALLGSKKFGLDTNILNRIAKEIKHLVELNIQVAVIIGGGNLFRGSSLVKEGMNRVIGDHIGILATIMNGLAIFDALQRICVNACVMSSIPVYGVCAHYTWNEAIRLLRDGTVVILSAGTGNPFFTTDSAACLRGIEIEAEAVLKATKVDGVFTTDPTEDPSAIMYDRLIYNEVLEKDLKIMDPSALTLAREYKLPIRVFNMKKPDALLRVVMGKKEGTLITE